METAPEAFRPLGVKTDKSRIVFSDLSVWTPKGRKASGADSIPRKLGPGLVTGASDDDPSGIATYSQVGARFGYGMLWTMLFAYVGSAFYVHLPWSEVMHAVVVPKVEITREYLTALIAVLGTTISPYLFFWQASQEVEEVTNNPGEQALRQAPGQARIQLGRIRIDTYVGMAFANLVAFFIILTTAATLHN